MSEKEEPFDLRSRAGLGEHKTPPAVIRTAGEKKRPKKMKKSTDFSVVKRQTGMLSNDSCSWSLSYKGFSGRANLWHELIGYVIFILPITWLYSFVKVFEPDSDLEHTFFCLLLISLALWIADAWPCVIRRSRQLTGGVIYGWVVNLLTLFTLAAWWNIPASRQEWIIDLLMLLPWIPLLFIKGRYAGAKNELMRAAIEGNMAQVKKLAEHQKLGQKSEMGYTAREYAEKRGHTEIAAYLREMEKLQRSPHEVNEGHSVNQNPHSATEASKVVSINEGATENIATAVGVGTPSTEESPSPSVKEATSPQAPTSDAPSPRGTKKIVWIWLLVAILIITNLILGAVYIRVWSENAVQKPLLTEFQSNIRTLERENAAMQTQVQSTQATLDELQTQLKERSKEQESSAALKDENEQLKKRADEVSAEYTELRETVERLSTSLARVEKEKEELREKLAAKKEIQNPTQPSANNASKEEQAAKAKSIVQRFIESQSSDGGDVGYEELHYPVSFLEYGIQDKAFVMSDRQEYKAKFPKRRFIWHDDATVKETEVGKEWLVTAHYHCIVQSAKGKWIGCQMKGSYILRDYPGEGVRINSLTEDLVRRYTPDAAEISAAFKQAPTSSAQQQAEMDGVFFKNYRYVSMVVLAGDDYERDIIDTSTDDEAFCLVCITLDKQAKTASLNIIREENGYGDYASYYNDRSPLNIETSGNSCVAYMAKKAEPGEVDRDFKFVVASFGSEVNFDESGNPNRRIMLSKGKASSMRNSGTFPHRFLTFNRTARLIGHNEPVVAIFTGKIRSMD